MKMKFLLVVIAVSFANHAAAQVWRCDRVNKWMTETLGLKSVIDRIYISGASSIAAITIFNEKGGNFWIASSEGRECSKDICKDRTHPDILVIERNPDGSPKDIIHISKNTNEKQEQRAPFRRSVGKCKLISLSELGLQVKADIH